MLSQLLCIHICATTLLCLEITFFDVINHDYYFCEDPWAVGVRM